MDSVTEHRAIVDTHRHPIGPKLADQDGRARLLRPETKIPADQRSGLDRLSQVYDLDLRHAQAARWRRHPQPCTSNGGEVDWLAQDCFKSAPATLKS